MDLRVGPRRAVPAVALVGACCVAAPTPIGDDEGQTLCAYRMTTGGWCPGCGCTRALRSIVRVDLTSALQLNPWMLLIFVQAVALAGWIAVAPARALDWFARHDTRVLGVNLTVGLAIWATRMATGEIPTPF